MRRLLRICLATVLVTAVTGGVVTPALATSTSAYFSATSANVRCDWPGGYRSDPYDSQTRSDTSLIKSRQGGLLGTQENCRSIQGTVLGTLGSTWGHYIPTVDGGPIEVPIFWRRVRWRLVGKGYRKLSPGRYAAWVLLEHRATGLRVVRVNTHWVAGAFTSGDPTRKARWDADRSGTKALVKSLSRRHPAAAVIVTGDFNEDRSGDVLGSFINGHKVIYDIRPSKDSDWVIHLGNRHLVRVSTSTIPCSAYTEYVAGAPMARCQRAPGRGVLYTDHASTSVEFHLTR